MKFLWSTITVLNMKESLAFYQEVLELPINRSYSTPEGMELAFLGTEETQVELIYAPNRPVPATIAGITLGFQVASLDEAMAAVIAKGISIESGPFQPNPNIKFFYIKDPNGVTIQLVEQM